VLRLMKVSIANAKNPTIRIDFIKVLDRVVAAAKKNAAHPNASKDIILSWYVYDGTLKYINNPGNFTPIACAIDMRRKYMAPQRRGSFIDFIFILIKVTIQFYV